MPSNLRRLCLFALLLLWAIGGHAEEKKWSLSPYVGLHHPNLDELNSGLFQAPYAGTAQNIDEFGSTIGTDFSYKTPLPSLQPGVLTGLEFEWRVNDRHSMLIGAGTWNASSYTTASDLFPVQGAFESALSYRKGDLNYNEFYFGWRYNVLQRPKKHKLYLRLSMHEVFDMAYREDFSLLFLSGPPKSFRRSSVVQAKGTGLLMLQAGGGGEWFVTEWLSLGMEGGYTLATKDVLLSEGRIRTDFLDTDNLALEVPLLPSSDTGQIGYIPESGNARLLKLSFDGWKALLKITVYY